ncbi:DUF350 domain-containing protein [Alterinioella nitratireducens]|jgi:uncharacterized membrane protein YjfL (UPF0719 family)|uniref:DUF350 domain-containing protein n=1 Tax=Alterinioella nitratireducens TaxID=2735915 RepID=UPI000C51C172|nr:DUF350 domain-containing protein [Alterinioella nitratireducens]MAX74022.1 DUF350 domain-containing protein [Nioella sp.]NPD21396.1 DUF350 domain-containing protein [Alterinioella nitratireducens]|tara:strand:- start:1143 stop:1367 length:225 start_codon:yes stop_codon:yes gene_type:complete
MDAFWNIELAELVGTIFYTFLGMVLMAITWRIIVWISPFSIVKEIEEDQNIALAVLIGMLFVSMAIIIAAVIVS